jgi:hypothetical protein
MSPKQLRGKRKAISPVVSTIILSAAVIVVGGSIWNYAHGASSVIASNYVNDTMDLVAEVSERFIVENVSNNSDSTLLTICIYNYGQFKIKTDLYVSVDGNLYTSDFSNPIIIEPGSRAKPTIAISAEKGDSIGIQVHSRRQNDAYFTYEVI